MKKYKTRSHICLLPAQNTTKPPISQKYMDITLMIVSFAGLIRAFLFLLTITR